MEKMKEFFVITVSLKTLPSFFIITVSCPSVQFPIPYISHQVIVKHCVKPHDTYKR